MSNALGMKIKLLGEPAILDGDGANQGIRGHQAWAVLARVLLARVPLDRRSLAAELFPEAVDPLGSLRWCLAALRKALNSSACLTGDPIDAQLPDGVTVDVWQLETPTLNASAFDADGAGPLLDGVDPRSSPEFATWLLIERARIAGVVEARLRQETLRAISLEDYDRAIRLAEQGVRHNPFNEGMHVLLVKSLALAGHHDAALAQATATEKLFLEELGERPSVALRSAARRSIAAPPAGVSPSAYVNSLMESGLAALSAGATDAGIDCLRRAISEAEAVQDRYLLAKSMHELGTALVHAIRGYDDEGAVLLRQSTELAQQRGYAGIAANGFRELGYVEALAGRRPSAATYLAQALDCAEGSADLAGIHAVTGFNLVDWGSVDEGLAQYETALMHARTHGQTRREIWALGLGARGLLVAGRLADADRWLNDCLALVEEQRWIAFRPWPVAVLAESRLLQAEDPASLRPRLEETFALSCQLSDPCWEAATGRVLALAHAAAADLTGALAWLNEAGKRCVRETDKYAALQVEILASQVEISRRLGAYDEADAYAREWVALAARTHMNAHVAQASAAIIGGPAADRQMSAR